MAREKRRLSSQDCYHIILRGNNNLCLFQEQQDFREFQYILDAKLEQLPEVSIDCFYIGHYHFHGILYARKQEVTSFCTKVSASYAWAYNHKYNHKGAVFQKRFLSEPINGMKDYNRISHHIEHHPKRDSWRFDSRCKFEHWQEALYECPIILDVPNDLYRQKVAIFSRIARKKMEDVGMKSIYQLCQDEELCYLVQKEVKRILGPRNEVQKIMNDFLQNGNLLAPSN